MSDSLRRKSYLTLPSVTSLRDPFCLGTFACVFARKQCILCSALRHKSYLTLPYVTSLRDSFCCPLARLLVGNKQARLCRKWLFTLFYKYVQHYYSQLSIRQTSRKSRHLGMVSSFLQCCTLTFCKADISLRKTLMSVPVVPVLEGLTYCRDFSHRRPSPVSDHFFVHQEWSLTRELTVYSTLCSLSVNVFSLDKSLTD